MVESIKMKFIPPESGILMDLFRLLADKEGYNLTSPETPERFVSKVDEEFRKAKSNPSMIYGFRTQAMFEFVAASLGRCLLIKTEDCGGLYSTEIDIKVPDFRILLSDGQEIFVEVKNFNQRSPTQKYSLKSEYVDKLQKYANMFGNDIKIAIYWNRWNCWTLTPIHNLDRIGNKSVISFEEALKANEMAILGDYLLGTLSPLKFRLIANSSHPRVVNEDGTVKFTIGDIELYCGNHHITRSEEQNVAFGLMMYGDWPLEQGDASIEDDNLIYLEFISQPEVMADQHDFQMIGRMSSIVARQFSHITSPDGEVERLSPGSRNVRLGVGIPDNYRGEALLLWQFIQVPD